MNILTAGNLKFPRTIPNPTHKAKAAVGEIPYSFAKWCWNWSYANGCKCSTHKPFAVIHAKKRNSDSEPKPTILEQLVIDDEDDVVNDIPSEDDEIQDEAFLDEDDSYFEDEELDLKNEDDSYFEEEELELAAENTEVYVGDGAEGGGISLAGTWWDKEAFAIAEEVTRSFDGDLGMYAFRTLLNSTIQVRIENLTRKSGSPSMEDIEAFTTTYRAKLDAAELAKSVPDNLYLEVSSPGVERVVRIPHDLERFKERPMYVKYVTETTATGSASESDGIFKLVSFDMETKSCTWGLADVRKNREKAGKGRPLSKKQREWWLHTPFESLRIVRLYSDI